VFVVGYLGDWRRAAAVLFERHSLSGHPAPRRETGQSVARSIRAQSQSSHREDSDNFLATWPAEIAPTLNAHFGDKQGIENQHINGGAGMFVPAISPCLDTQKGGLRGPDTQAYVVGALPASLGKGGLGHNKDDFCVPVAFDWQSGGDARGLEPKDTAQLQRCQVPAVAQASAVRRLTPRECERLQGFPDDYTAIPWRKKGSEDCPDGPRYKALGNSMAVPVMRWIGERIAAVEAFNAS
jgi:DNA (cytosine-5)-methyltransferase 1